MTNEEIRNKLAHALVALEPGYNLFNMELKFIPKDTASEINLTTAERALHTGVEQIRELLKELDS